MIHDSVLRDCIVEHRLYLGKCRFGEGLGGMEVWLQVEGVRAIREPFSTHT